MRTIIDQHTGALVLELAQVPRARPLTQKMRYWTSERIDGVLQYWATVGHRAKADHFGLQFVGKRGENLSKRFGERLEALSFYRRRDTTGNTTFARKIPFRSDGSSDAEGILQAKTTLESILQETRAQQNQLASENNEHEKHLGFASRLRASLPFFVDLELPSRAEPLSDRELF